MGRGAVINSSQERCHPFVDIFMRVCIAFVAAENNTSPSGYHGEIGTEKFIKLCFIGEEVDTRLRYLPFKIFFREGD